ncbi:hypothetical protein D5R93_01790 [Actinomyces lilanjuaniae]|uniref:DUF5668 domain-containing protein n=1 Tax=Actinomyces lilanjuaniae TaxID=2321394 RepID=A0ABN5PLL8_9ACTO|nr:hypothetical protein D5R93_01790 [Actinomyces lilanjuaniae]
MADNNQSLWGIMISLLLASLLVLWAVVSLGGSEVQSSWWPSILLLIILILSVLVVRLFATRVTRSKLVAGLCPATLSVVAIWWLDAEG